MVQNTKKFNCKVQIHVGEVVYFQEFKVIFLLNLVFILLWSGSSIVCLMISFLEKKKPIPFPLKKGLSLGAINMLQKLRRI